MTSDEWRVESGEKVAVIGPLNIGRSVSFEKMGNCSAGSYTGTERRCDSLV